jgi:lysophospholipase L1-like esterase
MADGDSITVGYGLSSPSTQGYPPQALSTMNPENLLTNVAVLGVNSQQVINHLASAVTPVLSAYNAPVKIYSLMIGTNDFGSGFTATQTYANIQSICSTVTGTNGVKMILLTLLPATGNASFETYRQAVNTLERAGGSCTYTLADVGNDATIGQPGDQTNATYFQSDEIHPTAAGDVIVASYMKTALLSLGAH